MSKQNKNEHVKQPQQTKSAQQKHALYDVYNSNSPNRSVERKR